MTKLIRRGVLPSLGGSGGAVGQAWQVRTSALAAHGRSLPAGSDVDAVLEALLHMHYNRALGIDREQERTCRRLARQAALASIARQEAAAR